MYYSTYVAFLGNDHHRSNKTGDVKSYAGTESTNKVKYSSEDDS